MAVSWRLRPETRNRFAALVSIGLDMTFEGSWNDRLKW